MCFLAVTGRHPQPSCTPSHPTCMVMVGVVRPLAAVSVVCAADTVMAVGLITWLERVAMVPNVVMGVAREALVLWPPAPARLVETVPVTVPRVVTPKGRERQNQDDAHCWCLLLAAFLPAQGWGALETLQSAPNGYRRLQREHLHPPPGLLWELDPERICKVSTHLWCPSQPMW